MRHLDLCSGIGGFALGLQATGYFQTVGFCEIDTFCQKVLKKNFPDIPIYNDIKTLKPNDEKIKPDIVTAGFPCQPFSVAGKQKSDKDDRNLWKETLRIIQESRPSWFIGENVNGIIKLYLDTVLEDLERENYSTRVFNISASSIGARHERKRVWIIANSNDRRCKSRNEQHQGECTSSEERINTVSRSDTISNSESKWTGKSRNSDQTKRNKSCDETQFNSSCSNVSNSNSSLRNRRSSSRQSGTNKIWSFHTPEKEQTSHEIWSKFEGYDALFQQCQNWWTAQSSFCGTPDGISYELDKNRRKRVMALGNAIVPQIPYFIGKAIGQIDG